MSIRVCALLIVVGALSLYAWKDWFVSLCGLVLLMAVMQHPDMPKSMLGVQGLNPWNVLMGVVLCAWMLNRHREGLRWDLTPGCLLLLLLYFSVVVISFLRMMTNLGIMERMPLGYLVSEYLINSIKWVIPGLLIFDGCRSRNRLLGATACVIGLYALLAVQVIRWMPPRYALTGSDVRNTANKLIQNEVGYSRVNMSMMLSGASWAMLAALPLALRSWQRFGLVSCFIALTYAQALTGGRMGYITWGMLGLLLGGLRWRRILLAAPIVPIAIAVILPGVTARALEGFGYTDASGGGRTDMYAVTAGRTLIWPLVIDEIMESPVIGYGRQAMVRTGLRDQIAFELNEAFGHPHNAYLEMLLDNGVVGILPVLLFFAVIVWRSQRLFLVRSNPISTAVGGIALCLTLAFLIASMGSQTFYPREGAVGMWCAIGLMLRVYLVQPPLSRSAVPVPSYSHHGGVSA